MWNGHEVGNYHARSCATIVMAMKSIWDNLVARGLVLMLVALFAVPCVVCDDGIAHFLCQHSHHTVQAIQDAGFGTGCDTCKTPPQEGPPCQCLSDTSKVHSSRFLTTLIVPDAALPPVRITLPETVVIRVAFAKADCTLPPLLVNPAVAGRAPPAA